MNNCLSKTKNRNKDLLKDLLRDLLSIYDHNLKELFNIKSTFIILG